MSLFIASINSGSNGNCYYVGNHNEGILVDAGISCREIEKRMSKLGLSLQKVKAVFISHEHSDHIRGLTVLAKKHQLPVYITQPTLLEGRLELNAEQVFSFCHDEIVEIGDLQIHCFSKHHDAADPYSFMISGEGVNVGVFTDLGISCDNLIHYFKQCHAAFLEANYDDEMLDKGNYPYHLKRRIKGGKGHLSNKQALELFLAHRPAHMSHLLLAHLSKNNNCPDLVQQLFNQHANGVQMTVASRYEESALFQILHSPSGHIISTKRIYAKQLEMPFG